MGSFGGDSRTECFCPKDRAIRPIDCQAHKVIAAVDPFVVMSTGGQVWSGGEFLTLGNGRCQIDSIVPDDGTGMAQPGQFGFPGNVVVFGPCYRGGSCRRDTGRKWASPLIPLATDLIVLALN